MRHLARLTVLAALLVFAGAALADSPPRVRIAANSPLRLNGSGFVAAEKVAVEVEFRGDTYASRTRATDAGTFTAVFAGVRVTRCGHDVEIRAIGNRGSRFHVTLHQPACSST
jgi:hypothetical protein